VVEADHIGSLCGRHLNFGADRAVVVDSYLVSPVPAWLRGVGSARPVIVSACGTEATNCAVVGSLRIKIDLENVQTIVSSEDSVVNA
jgi:hypothetical protein